MNLRNRLPLLVLLIIFVGVAVVALANRPTVADANIALPPGYQIEAVATGLTFPTAITWDDQRNLYVAEAGYAYGPKEVEPGRILRITNGHKEIVYDNLSSPVTDIKVYQGEMYIAHKGFLSVIRDGQRKDLITGLPWGDHFTCSIAFDEQGYIYLGNGTATNAGVVGEDNFRFGWAASFPDQRDIPAKDIFLTGQNYASLDLRTAAPNDKTSTGPYMPFGTESTPDQVVHGKPEASGVVLRIKPDGSDLQVYAWGLRNPFGMGFDANGRLVVVDQGYDDRGVRPIANAPIPFT